MSQNQPNLNHVNISLNGEYYLLSLVLNSISEGRVITSPGSEFHRIVPLK